MSEHNTKTVRHFIASGNTVLHAEGGDCGTRFEAWCSCGFVQGARCREHANAIEHGHRADPSAPVIQWNAIPLTATTITDQQLCDLFGRHCACRPLDLERVQDEHAALHDCDTEILCDVQVALGFGLTLGTPLEALEATREARGRCAAFINEQREAGR